MKKNNSTIFKRIGLSILSMAMVLTAQATNYTVVASGNFSSSTTWSGGVVPTIILAGDNISIPSGYTVTLDNNINFNVAATLDVDGTLESGTNMTAMAMTAGNITGSGTIDVDSISLALVSGITFTGDIIADHMSTWITTFNSTADVTVNTSLYVMAGLLSITDGTLNLGNNATIYIDGGSISLGGNGMLGLTSNYNVVYHGSGSNSGLELTGSGLQDVMIDLSSGSVTLTGDVVINGTLDLENGNLILNGNDLALATNGDIDATGSGSIYADANANITINTLNSLTGDLTFGSGNNTVHNLTINLGSSSSNVDLGSDITVTGMLTLSQGTLTLNNNDLNFAVNGNFSSMGNGSLVSTSGSNITITSNINFNGGIRFNNTGNTVNNLTINLGTNTGYASLGSDLHVSGMLTLTSGLLHTWNNNLMLNAGATISGGSEDSYVITGDGGHLTINLAANNSATFHVGTEGDYTPAVITANSGSVTSDISVMVNDSVWSGGTTGSNLAIDRSIVNNTWFITSSQTTGLDLDLQLMWAANLEVNGFNRTQSYIAHHMNGNWDVAAAASATAQGNMYVMNRDNITSLSPFIVADNNSALSVNNVVAAGNASLSLYPNPAADVVSFSTTGAVTTVAIYDVTGRKVKTMNADGNSFNVSDLTPGYYNVQLTGKDFTATQQFIKK
ncbi:MAG: T9SS type A sorting domain-containing protein [Flavipsychrobacter sp.]|nr:T9SS type A sorting domain-containing protein [Flavipsychrobacter sp.]